MYVVAYSPSCTLPLELNWYQTRPLFFYREGRDKVRVRDAQSEYYVLLEIVGYALPT